MATPGDNEASCPEDITTSLSHQPGRNNKKIAVNLDGVARTLLVPLIARAYDNTLRKPILGDQYANHVLEKIDFDANAMPMTSSQKLSIALRTRHFDIWVGSFLKLFPNTTVLHLACGFDSRMQRVKWGENTRWIDLDLPEVIDLRKQIQPISLPGKNYSLLGLDVLGQHWMHDIGDVSGPVLVIMEGLLAYLPENDAKGLIQRICQTFPEGEMLFESVSSAALKYLNRPGSMEGVSKAGAPFQSSIDDPVALEALHPRLRLIESIPIVQVPGIKRLPLLNRMMMYFASWLPSGRDAARLLRFRIGEPKVPGSLWQ